MLGGQWSRSKAAYSHTARHKNVQVNGRPQRCKSFIDFKNYYYRHNRRLKNRVLPAVNPKVRRRSCRTFSTHFEIFRRRFDGVVIYFFDSHFKFFDDASEFSVTSLCVVFLFKVHVSFSSSQVSVGTRII